MRCCRYMYQHGYNISLVDMVDKIASPLVKQFLTSITYKKLDVWPTPADYAHAVSVCAACLLAPHLWPRLLTCPFDACAEAQAVLSLKLWQQKNCTCHIIEVPADARRGCRCAQTC